MRTVFELATKKEKLEELEKETHKIDFWQDQENAKLISQEIADIKEELLQFDFLNKEINELSELNKLADENLSSDLEIKITELERKISKQEYLIYLSGKYDKNNAILEIFSGAGGIDAQDWATMLLRMYERYCQIKGFDVSVLHQSFGEGGGPDGRIGTKNATLEIRGKYAYGFLKRESGVHRLVRISPFSAQKLRHTSFALVEVLPEISDQDSKIEIKPEEIKIDTFRAGGPGGQYTNKTESAIRITHLATGIVVTSQTERLQGKNKENVLKVLKSKLFLLQEEAKDKKLKEIKGQRKSVEFGSQIRNYVLHPYKMVKDLRTEIESKDPEKVLDGELDEFIQAEIRIK